MWLTGSPPARAAYNPGVATTDLGVLNNNRLKTKFTGMGLLSGVPIAAATFKTNELQRLHVTLSDDLPPNTTPSPVRLEIHNSQGTLILNQAPTGAGAVPGTKAVLYETPVVPADAYFVVAYSTTKPNPPFSPTVTVSGGDNWGVIVEPTSTRAYHIGVYSATPRTDINTPRIAQGVPTWVVIGGRNSKPAVPGPLTRLATALSNLSPVLKPQVLVADWEDAAHDNNVATTLPELNGSPLLSNLGGKRWIKGVGDRVAQALQSAGVVGANLNLVGHSWGCYVAQQTAHDYYAAVPSDRINGLVALDPALVGADGTDDYQDHLAASWLHVTALGGLATPADYFSRVARNSWAFYCSNLGNYPNALTAGASFVVLNSNVPFHLQPTVSLFSNGIGPVVAYVNAEYGKKDPAARRAHSMVVDVFTKAVIQNSKPMPSLLGGRFAVNPFFQWPSNRVRCNGGDGTAGDVAVRQASETDSSYNADYPLSGVLRVDDASNVLQVWP